jgi:hypothetical protein
MKQIISTTFGITLEQLDVLKNEETRIALDDEFGETFDTTTFRRILQRFGTEGMKPVFGDDVWAKLGANKALGSDTAFTIISDYSFDIEYDVMRAACLAETLDYGTSVYLCTIHIDSVQDLLISVHPSERTPEAPFDYNVDNSRKDATVKYWVQEFVQTKGWKYNKGDLCRN